MANVAIPSRAGVKPRVLVSTSLIESKLNVHISREIVSVLRRTFEVTFLPSDLLVQRDSFSDCHLLLYIGSSLSEVVPLGTMAAMARVAKIPSVFWATDDPYEFDARYRANDFDAYFSNDRNTSDHYLERDNVFHLPLAAASSDYRPLSPLKTRRLGMFFCGYPYGCRRRVVSDMLKVPNFSRNDLVVMGDDWNIPNLKNIASDSNHDRLIDFYSTVQFTLNIGRDFDIANEHRKLVATTPGPRTFECALAGSGQIFFANSLEIEDYYLPGHEIIVVESVEEAVERFHWFRERPEAWMDMVKAAQIRSQQEHLYEHRLAKMFSKLHEVGILNRTEASAVQLVVA